MAQDEYAEPGRLTREEVAKVAKLALLNLSDDELDMFTDQLGAVLDRASDLQNFDVAGVPPTDHPYPVANVLRPDTIEDWTGFGDAALEQAPEVEDRMFKVAPALGEQP